MEQQQIFTMLFDKDEVSWQSMIYDLVKTEQMDPWDINISFLAQKFLERLNQLKVTDLRLSGKVLLASAIFLKIKSNKLMEEDINALDTLIASADTPEETAFYEELFDLPGQGAVAFEERPKIYPRTPQPRKRKISVFDLVKALEKALEVENRRKPAAASAPEVVVPDKPRDITLIIREVYNKIVNYFGKKKNSRLTFRDLLPGETKEDKVFTFIPLLHLDCMRQIDLMQEQHFGEIEIKLAQKAA